jgi:formylglycine-generating enzyme required for sulfatase activity
MEKTRKQRRGLPAPVLFLLSALATMLVLGVIALALAYFTGNLPPQLADLLPPWAEASPTSQPVITPPATRPATTVPEGATATPEGQDTATPEPTTPVEPTAEPGGTTEDGIVLGGVEMVSVPGGTFLMGRASDRSGHLITLDPYYIDRAEVTNALWSACVEAGACSPPDPTTDYLGDAYYGTDAFAAYPVINISWFDADAYCRWRGARLPTEAEWEMAARWDPASGVTLDYPWDNVFDPERLNYCDSSCALGNGDPAHDDGWPQAAPVGSFPLGASPLGLVDMAGNVAEWVADWYSATYYEVSPAQNPTGPESGTERVVRGAAWGVANPDSFRSTVRVRFKPDLRGPGIGVRCAISASEVTP